MAQAGVLHQHLANDFGGYGEEVRSVLPINTVRVDEPKISLIHQCAGLQGDPWPLPSQLEMGKAMQFRIDQRH